MPGNAEGARKGRDTNLKKDPDYYKKIASKGGKSHKRGGFASQNIGKDGLTGPERAKKIWEERRKEMKHEDN
jgi:general stress protein YciG